jgi:hypothetical protein
VSAGPWKIFGAMRHTANPRRQAAWLGRQAGQQGIGDAEMGGPIRPHPIRQPAKLGRP